MVRGRVRGIIEGGVRVVARSYVGLTKCKVELRWSEEVSVVL